MMLWLCRGGGHMLLLRKDGTVWGWGYNGQGQIDPNDDSNFISQPRQIQGIKDVVDISGGTRKSSFLTASGEVYIMGALSDADFNHPLKIDALKNIVRIEGTSSLLLALDKDGVIYFVGDVNEVGIMSEIIHTNNAHPYAVGVVKFPRKVVDFSAKLGNPMILLDNGEVWAWGNNDLSSLAMADGKDIGKPTKHSYLHQIVNIGEFSAVDVHGNLYVWGTYAYGNPLAPSTLRRNQPVKIKTGIKPLLLVHTGFAGAVLTQEGDVWTWGWNKDGQLGTGKLLTEHASKKDILTLNKSLFTTH